MRSLGGRLAILGMAAIVGMAACTDDDAATTTVTEATPSTTIGSTTTTLAPTTTGGPTTTTTVPPAQIFPTEVSCSTELASFPCSALVDADEQTRWNAPGGGVGATLEFVFDRPIQIAEIVFTNVPDPEGFARNARVRWIEVTVDDVAGMQRVELLDANTPQSVGFITVASSVVRMEVTGAFQAEAFEGRPPFDELALADVGFLGYLADPVAMPAESAVGRPAAGGLSTISQVVADRDGLIIDLAFDGTSFLALVRIAGGETGVWASPDGITWERLSTIGWFDPDDGPSVLTAVGDGRLIAGGRHFASASLWLSDDGTTWREARLESASVADVVATQVGVVAVGETAEGAPAAWWSEDGTEWEATIEGELEGAVAPLQLVAASPELLVAVGRHAGEGEGSNITVATSLDGIVWRTVEADGLDVTGFADLTVLDGSALALEPAGPALWTASDPASWAAESLRWIVAPVGRVPSAVAVVTIGDRLVVVGATRPLLPAEGDLASVAEAWMRDPGGIWVPMPQPQWDEEPVAMIPTAAVAGQGRLVVAVETPDTGLAVWVVQPI